MMREYLLPLFADFKFTRYLKHDQAVADDAVTPEYLTDHGWLVGSPRTVRDKLIQMHRDLGGFGTLLLFYVRLRRPSRAVLQVDGPVGGAGPAILRRSRPRSPRVHDGSCRVSGKMPAAATSGNGVARQ